MSEQFTFKILLIEDHSTYRQGLERIIGELTDHTCVGSYSTLEDGLAAIDSPSFANLVLLDIGLPGMNGIEGIHLIREKLPAVKIIILTAFTNKEKVFQALEQGAHGYLIKSTNSRRLIQILDEVAEGGTPLDPKIAGMVLSSFQKLSPSVPDDKNSLSNREIEVLKLVAAGQTRVAIAAQLEISSHTVTDYVRRIYDKLQVKSLPAAVATATRKGLLDFSE